MISDKLIFGENKYQITGIIFLEYFIGYEIYLAHMIRKNCQKSFMLIFWCIMKLKNWPFETNVWKADVNVVRHRNCLYWIKLMSAFSNLVFQSNWITVSWSQTSAYVFEHSIHTVAYICDTLLYSWWPYPMDLVHWLSWWLCLPMTWSDLD